MLTYCQLSLTQCLQVSGAGDHHPGVAYKMPEKYCLGALFPTCLTPTLPSRCWLACSVLGFYQKLPHWTAMWKGLQCARYTELPCGKGFHGHCHTELSHGKGLPPWALLHGSATWKGPPWALPHGMGLRGHCYTELPRGKGFHVHCHTELPPSYTGRLCVYSCGMCMKMCVFKVSITFFFTNLFNALYECPLEPIYVVCVIAGFVHFTQAI